MPSKPTAAPDSTAVRVALWRAMHVEVDPPPHVLEDTIGLQLAAPDAGWRQRGDMDPVRTRAFRASIVARARFIEDLLAATMPGQYVILGAGLDTFVQRRPELASRMRVFEVDKPGPQEWKKQRLTELGYSLPEFVPVDFEREGWWDRLIAAGFDPRRTALVASTGVSMYLTHDAIEAMLRQTASLARGSTFVMTYLLPIELADPEERPGYEFAIKGARASGTPFISFFAPDEIVALARECGFREARNVSGADLTERYGLRLSKSEEILVATT